METRKDAHILSSGMRIAIVGGGPAGSCFALFALHYARQRGLDLDVTIFEPRDYTRPAPWGCNMGAGLIPVRELKQLAEIGVSLPPHIIRNHIDRYTLHTAAGQIQISQPDPDGDMISVYRGNGPRLGPAWDANISFDGFLQESARAHGARVVPKRVTEVVLAPTVEARVEEERYPADLIVLATGINQRTVSFSGLVYQPPPRLKMAQTEICSGVEAVHAALGNSVHVVLPRRSALKFGTLVPKGPCINVSLLGGDLPSGSIAHFLELPEVAALLPGGAVRACNCRPLIVTGAARPLYADNFVAVGDAGITRLYKNGIGAAIQAVRQAAYTAVVYGVSEAAFQAYYAPFCRRTAWDNQVGRLLFASTGLFQNHTWFARLQLQSMAAEQSLPPAQRLHSRILWGMFTGTYTYMELLRMALHPGVTARLLRYLPRSLRRSSAQETLAWTPPPEGRIDNIQLE
ncbi:MAG: hypothetical protein HY328_00225 [Chloroflexi bacterium]|nr:hypothetical protein [Chloroflexota bacterium]